MAMFSFNGENEEEERAAAQRASDNMAELMGPGHVDQSLRQAISSCWMPLPRDRKNVDALEKQCRRIFERALRDIREDWNEMRGAGSQ